MIEEWHKLGCVLLMGYELYRQLDLKKKNKKPKKKKDPNNLNSDNVIDIEEEAKNKDLLDGES